jgi:hypothetical protein
MRNGRMLTRWRAAALTTLAVLGLAACEGEGTDASVLLGTWHATLQGVGQHQEHTLQITPTAYVWTQETYGPGGRPDDGLEERFTHSGEWEIRGDRLALRAGAMQYWTYPTGEEIVDFAVQWDPGNRIESLQGDRMTITYEPAPEVSYARPTLYFERVR